MNYHLHLRSICTLQTAGDSISVRRQNSPRGHYYLSAQDEKSGVQKDDKASLWNLGSGVYAHPSPEAELYTLRWGEYASFDGSCQGSGKGRTQGRAVMKYNP